MERSRIVLLALGCEGIFGAVALGFAWWLDIELFGPDDLNFSALAVGVASAAALMSVFSVSYNLPMAAIRAFREQVREIIERLFARCTWGDLALISLAAGWGEELLFRGLLQRALEAPMGVLGALIAASLLFGLCHAISWLYALYASLAGLALGGLLIATDNLVVPIVAHALYDFLALGWLLRPKLGGARASS